MKGVESECWTSVLMDLNPQLELSRVFLLKETFLLIEETPKRQKGKFTAWRLQRSLL